MAGPGESISAVLTCTKIYHDDLADQVLDREKNPEWQGECTKLVYEFPTDTKLWDRYAQERAESLRMGHGGREATEYYRKHREAMDAGARVAWPERYDSAKELSALQHAMNLKLRDEAAFFAEYQNEPVAEDYAREALTADEVIAKASGRPSGHVPTACTRMTMFVDVHDKLLYWCVCAWQEDFTGCIVDYGAYPDQKRAVYTLRDARRSLRHAAPGTGREGAITAGLVALCGDYLAREWRRADWARLRIERCLVDAGYMPTVVYDACRRIGGAMMPSKGVGIGAAHKPMAEYRRKKRKGDWLRSGAEVPVPFLAWHIPNVRPARELRHVRVVRNGVWLRPRCLTPFRTDPLSEALWEPSATTAWPPPTATAAACRCPPARPTTGCSQITWPPQSIGSAPRAADGRSTNGSPAPARPTTIGWTASWAQRSRRQRWACRWGARQ